MIILGSDEAGYGPNLGPLVVSLTVWEASSDDLSFLFEPLKKAGITIADSKKLYSGGSLAALESGVLAPLRSLNNTSPLADDFSMILHQHQTRLLDMRYRTVEPEEFNRLLDQFNSKGSLLSHVTLRLISDQLKKLVQENKTTPILVLCDKHGGRNHYLDILTEFFPGEFIQPVQESRESSVYFLNWQGRQLEFRFLAKGESNLPIALASMLSKYQRELAMARFNEFWRSHVPGLKPTAGYPEDAKRFKQQIAAAQERLGIADKCLWRKR